MLDYMSVGRSVVGMGDRVGMDMPMAVTQCADNGASVLMVTHENEAKKYADYIYRMEKGVLEYVRE